MCIEETTSIFCYLQENIYLKQWRMGWQHNCQGFDNKGEVFMQIMLININDMMHFAKLSWIAIINTKTRYLTSHIPSYAVETGFVIFYSMKSLAILIRISISEADIFHLSIGTICVFDAKNKLYISLFNPHHHGHLI